MDLAELQRLIRSSKPEDFVTNKILASECPHFKPEQLEHVRKSVAEVTGINIKHDEIYVVGSAKLGFGLHQKTKHDGEILPAFRPFDANSDIDIAFASSDLFDMIWKEISTYAFSKAIFPARINKLGDYLVYGWLRPDHFPRDTRLLNYDRWNDKIRTLGRDKLLGRRKISGALYRNVEFITKYQARGITTCKKNLELS